MKKIYLLFICHFLIPIVNGQRYVWGTYNTSNSNLTDDLISSLAFDTNHGLWIGTECGGLNYFLNGNWTNYGSIYDCITSIQIDNSGKKWLGTFAGLEVFDGSNWTTYTTSNSSIPDNTILTVEIDNNDNKWVGTYQGVGKFTGSSWQVYNMSNSPIQNNTINKVYCGSDGRIWVGTNTGLASLMNSTWTVYTSSNSTLSDAGPIFDITEDGFGRIWVAQSVTLHKYESGTWTSYPAGEAIRTLSVDTQNHIWIGTYSDGIFQYDGGTWHNYYNTTVYTTSNSGICNNSSLSFASIYTGNHWTGTLQGLSHFTDTTQSSIAEIEINNLLIAPNPFTSQTTLTFTEEQKNVTIKIIDVFGKEIRKINFTGRQLTIYKGEMDKGIYLVSILNSQKQTVDNKKIIIQ